MRIQDLALRLLGSSSGEQIIKAAAAASGAITLPAGTTDFSATGGAGQVVQQAGAGAAFTVGQVALVSGTNTNDNAAAGNVGEYVVSTVGSPGVNLPNVTVTTATSISLTAGDWDVEGNVVVQPAGTTVIGAGPQCWVSTSNVTPPANELRTIAPSPALPAGQLSTMRVPQQRFSLAAPATIYMSAFVGVTVSTATTYGVLRARRMR